MVSERTIIRMLHYGHHLYSIVSSSFDSRKCQLFKLLISAHTQFLLSHSHMAFVDQRLCETILCGEIFICPSEILGKPKLTRYIVIFLILSDSSDICRDSI